MLQYFFITPGQELWPNDADPSFIDAMPPWILRNINPVEPKVKRDVPIFTGLDKIYGEGTIKFEVHDKDNVNAKCPKFCLVLADRIGDVELQRKEVASHMGKFVTGLIANRLYKANVSLESQRPCYARVLSNDKCSVFLYIAPLLYKGKELCVQDTQAIQSMQEAMLSISLPLSGAFLTEQESLARKMPFVDPNNLEKTAVMGSPEAQLAERTEEIEEYTEDHNPSITEDCIAYAPPSASIPDSGISSIMSFEPLSVAPTPYNLTDDKDEMTATHDPSFALVQNETIDTENSADMQSNLLDDMAPGDWITEGLGSYREAGPSYITDDGYNLVLCLDDIVSVLSPTQTDSNTQDTTVSVCEDSDKTDCDHDNQSSGIVGTEDDQQKLSDVEETVEIGCIPRMATSDKKQLPNYQMKNLANVMILTVNAMLLTLEAGGQEENSTNLASALASLEGALLRLARRAKQGINSNIVRCLALEFKIFEEHSQKAYQLMDDNYFSSNVKRVLDSCNRPISYLRNIIYSAMDAPINQTHYQGCLKKARENLPQFTRRKAKHTNHDLDDTYALSSEALERSNMMLSLLGLEPNFYTNKSLQIKTATLLSNLSAVKKAPLKAQTITNTLAVWSLAESLYSLITSFREDIINNEVGTSSEDLCKKLTSEYQALIARLEEQAEHQSAVSLVASTSHIAVMGNAACATIPGAILSQVERVISKRQLEEDQNDDLPAAKAWAPAQLLDTAVAATKKNIFVILHRHNGL